MKSYIFDIVCNTSFNEKNTLLKHANKFILFIQKMAKNNTKSNIRSNAVEQTDIPTFSFFPSYVILKLLLEQLPITLPHYIAYN